MVMEQRLDRRDGQRGALVAGTSVALAGLAGAAEELPLPPEFEPAKLTGETQRRGPSSNRACLRGQV